MIFLFVFVGKSCEDSLLIVSVHSIKTLDCIQLVSTHSIMSSRPSPRLRRTRPATASYRYRTPFSTTAPSGLVSPMRPSTATATHFHHNKDSFNFSSTYNPNNRKSPITRNRYHQGPRVPLSGLRANVSASARGRPIEMMWSMPSNNRPGVIQPPKTKWTRQDNVFTNTNYVLRTMADKSHSHDTQLQTINLYRDADASHAAHIKHHGDDYHNGSLITKRSMGKALENFGFQLVPEQVEEVFKCLSARNTSEHHGKDTMNAATFMENLKDCHELDLEKHHSTRFGSSFFAYTTRRENDGIDRKHRFPAQKKVMQPVKQHSHGKTRVMVSHENTAHHLASQINPFSHEEPDHDHEAKIIARNQYRRKQREARNARKTYRDARKRPMSRTQQFMCTQTDYSRYGKGKDHLGNL